MATNMFIIYGQDYLLASTIDADLSEDGMLELNFTRLDHDTERPTLDVPKPMVQEMLDAVSSWVTERANNN